METVSGLYTMDDAAREAGVLVQTISRAVREGRIPVVMVGKKKLISSAALSQYQVEQGHRNGARTKKGQANGSEI